MTEEKAEPMLAFFAEKILIFLSKSLVKKNYHSYVIISIFVYTKMLDNWTFSNHH